jgi:hypothetical protein
MSELSKTQSTDKIERGVLRKGDMETNLNGVLMG